MTQLDFTALEKATANLKKSLTRSQATKSDEELRDAVILRFEYTYELCWKMLKRQLENEAANAEEIDTFSFRQLIRDGAEKGIISDPEKWFVYRDQRNITSHIYDGAKAQSVYKTAVEFLPDAKLLLANLKQRAA